MKNSVYVHKELASGGWGKLSLSEQLGNIGSEVSRALHWRGRDEKIFWGAAERALELFDLTLDDPRWRERLREIARAREVFCDTVWNGAGLYNSTLEELVRYFHPFAYSARRAAA